jgi:hypothetical protein
MHAPHLCSSSSSGGGDSRVSSVHKSMASECGATQNQADTPAGINRL